MVTVQPRLQPGHSEPEARLQQPGAQVRGPALPGPVPGVPGVQHPALPSGWHVVLLVVLVKVLGDVWRWTLHEDTLVHKPSPRLRRGHLPGAAHGRGTLQHAALPRELVGVVRLVRV